MSFHLIPETDHSKPPHLRMAASSALDNIPLRRTMQRAMDGLTQKRADAFGDPVRENRLRDLGQAIKARTLAHLPDLLVAFEARCIENGIQLHWAQSREDAVSAIIGLLRAQNSHLIIKGKSMVSEEIGLNHALENAGMRVVESDLGEFIIQLADETPSHIIAPAIHKSVAEISALFQRCYPDEAQQTHDAEALVAFSRMILRRDFENADAGISGVNFAVAETGTLCLVENEGNGRLTTTAPPLHIALMGIEKLIPELDDLPVMLDLLTRSGTGQPITNYVNMISGPRRPGERDGPMAVHLILLDGRRSQMYQDELMRKALSCIRCGACMNHCPIYARIGGHSYQSVYPGPIGKILTPELMDKRPDMPHASTLCGACAEKCPVRIPIPDILRAQRATAAGNQSAFTAWRALIIWRLWAAVQCRPWLYRLTSRFMTRWGNIVPIGVMGPVRKWSGFRARPRFASETLHEAAYREGFVDG